MCVPRVCAVLDPSDVDVLEELAVTLSTSGFVTTHLQLSCSELSSAHQADVVTGEGRVETERQWHSAVTLIVADAAAAVDDDDSRISVCLFMSSLYHRKLRLM